MDWISFHLRLSFRVLRSKQKDFAGWQCRYSGFVFQYIDKQSYLCPFHFSFVFYGCARRDDVVCAACLLRDTCGSVYKGRDRLVIVDIRLFCLEAFTADHYRAYQSDAASRDAGGSHACLW